MNRSELLSVGLPAPSDLGRTFANEVGRQKAALQLGLSDLPTTTVQTAHAHMGACACALALVRNMSIYVRQGREVGQKQSRRGFQPSSLFEICPTTMDGNQGRWVVVDVALMRCQFRRLAADRKASGAWSAADVDEAAESVRAALESGDAERARDAERWLCASVADLGGNGLVEARA